MKITNLTRLPDRDFYLGACKSFEKRRRDVEMATIGWQVGIQGEARNIEIDGTTS